MARDFTRVFYHRRAELLAGNWIVLLYVLYLTGQR